MDCTRCTRFQRFIGVQTQNPISGCFVDRGVLLGGVALPIFDKYFCAKGFRNPDSAVGRARVDHDDFAFAISDQCLHAGQGARDVGLYVVSDDDDREDHAELLLLSARACRAALGLDGRGRPSPHELESLPTFARLGRAGAPVPTRTFFTLSLPMVESFTERGYARGRMRQKKNAAKREMPGEGARRSIADRFSGYCCGAGGCGGGFAGIGWSVRRSTTCGILGACVTSPRSASAI